MSATPSRLPVTGRAMMHPLLRKLLAKPYPAVMGVLNVTPDSFSDGGHFYAPGPAISVVTCCIDVFASFEGCFAATSG